MRFCLLIAISGLLVACSSAAKKDAAAASTTTVAAASSSTTTTKTSAATATTAASASAMKVVCAHGSDSRTLEVRAKDKGCELAYTKNGQEAVVASSVNGNDHCTKSLTKIQEKLSTAGFSCK
jgi:hypothetical protein